MIAEEEESISTEEMTWTVLSRWFRDLIAVDIIFVSVSIVEEESFDLGV